MISKPTRVADVTQYWTDDDRAVYFFFEWESPSAVAAVAADPTGLWERLVRLCLRHRIGYPAFAAEGTPTQGHIQEKFTAGQALVSLDDPRHVPESLSGSLGFRIASDLVTDYAGNRYGSFASLDPVIRVDEIASERRHGYDAVRLKTRLAEDSFKAWFLVRTTCFDEVICTRLTLWDERHGDLSTDAVDNSTSNLLNASRFNSLLRDARALFDEWGCERHYLDMDHADPGNYIEEGVLVGGELVYGEDVSDLLPAGLRYGSG